MNVQNAVYYFFKTISSKYLILFSYNNPFIILIHSERIHTQLTDLKNFILEYDWKLFEISKESEYEHCSMIKKSINENKEDYIYINLGKGKSESIFDE